jgi:hypothetical protein
MIWLPSVDRHKHRFACCSYFREFVRVPFLLLDLLTPECPNALAELMFVSILCTFNIYEADGLSWYSSLFH